MPDDKARRLVQAGSFKELGPVEARRVGREVPARPRVVGLEHIRRFLPRRVRPRQLVLEVINATGPRLGVVHAAQAENRGDVLAIPGPQPFHPDTVGEVVGAVRHPQPALQQVGSVVLRVVKALDHPQTEEILGVEIGHVQRIDVGPQRGAKDARQPGLVLDRGDAFEERLQRGQAAGLDRGLVEVGGVIVGRQLLHGRGGCPLLPDGLEQIPQLPGGLLRQGGACAPGAAVGRNLGVVQPAAIGVRIKIVTGDDGGFHGGGIDARNPGQRG
jgi:hypothetical protein